MKKISVTIFVFIIVALHTTIAQTKWPAVDKSPMDMCYYPAGFPVLKIQDKATEPLVSRVIYGRPQRNGRVIFGDLIPYGKVWRMGANEATEIEFYTPVRIGGVRIRKGRYSLYCIPFADKWTMILNRDTDTWGAFKYDETKDVTRLDVPVVRQSETVEFFSLMFEKTAGGANLSIGWDNIKVALPIVFKE
jgi:hypothetical protein